MGVYKLNSSAGGDDLTLLPTANISLTDDVPFVAGGVSSKNTIKEFWYQENKIRERTGTYLYSDFIATPATSASDSCFQAVNSGGASSVSGGFGNSHTGVLTFSSGTSGYAAVAPSTTAAFDMGGGYYWIETYLKIPTLSNGTNKFRVQFGFYVVNSTTVNPTNAISFLYDTNGLTNGSSASANWQCLTAASSVRSYTDSTVAIAADTWTRLAILVTNTSNAKFYINDVLVATNSSNIPTASLNAGLGIYWNAGLQRTLDCDELKIASQYTTNR